MGLMVYQHHKCATECSYAFCRVAMNLEGLEDIGSSNSMTLLSWYKYDYVGSSDLADSSCATAGLCSWNHLGKSPI